MVGRIGQRLGRLELRGRQAETEWEAGWDGEGGRMGLIGRQDRNEKEVGWD